MNPYLKDVCKIGQGAACCKYLVAGSTGLECMRVNPANKAVIDKNWENVEHVAQGDNCEGQKDLSKAQVNEKK